MFEGQIYEDVVYRWLNLLEGYFLVHDFSNWEKITFALLKAAPMSRTGGKPTVTKGREGNLSILGHTYLESFLRRHQGKILSQGELRGQVHTMDHAVTTKGSRCA